jgi:Tol biopolymer transport system component
VQAELARILASDVLVRSERLSAFLTFIVEQTLAGHGESLKEHVIAVEVYGKGTDFNADDPIVRVDARRLRDRLREYYATAPDSGIVISVPKGRYMPVFTRAAADVAQEAGPIPSSTESIGTRAARRWWIAAASVVLIAAASWGVTRLRTDGASPRTRLLTVTSMPGAEEDPSLSPDGNFVTFSWSGMDSDANPDIWVKAVDGDALRQLTSTPDAMEKYPVWSPDGRSIAFTRFVNGLPIIMMVSALGGPEQVISAGADATWFPDGRSLVMLSRQPNRRPGLVQHVVETGERRQLTETPEGFADAHPRVSPDGKTLAFTRSGNGRSAVLLVPMSGGEPTTLDAWSSGIIGGVEWMPDGQEILFGRPDVSGRRLLRMSVNRRGPAVPVQGIPYESLNPSVSRPERGHARLAISSGQPQIGLRLIDLQSRPEGGTLADSPFYRSTRMDAPGRFSPDGSQVAFESDRSGSPQVWVAKRDGSALRSVTQLQNATVSIGSWSPDSRSLTFDATIGESTHIYVVSASGGPLRRVTDARAEEIDPEWSRDGRWIYYASNESGSWAIWRVAAVGGARRMLTSEPGFEPRQSPDGSSLYFIDQQRVFGGQRARNLKVVSAEGGPAALVDAAVMQGAWDVTDVGIVFVAEKVDSPDASRSSKVLQAYDFATRRVHTLPELAFRVGPFGSSHLLKVSRDGRWALASRVDRWERDILVVDNFR